MSKVLEDMRNVMLKRFYPKDTATSSYDIDYKSLYESGKRGIIYDIDNTLVEHGADADRRAEELFAMLHKLGFKTCLLSNNDEERVKRFNRNIGTNYIYKAGKPAPKAYMRAIKLLDLKPDQVVFIGDQLFTDIYGANLLGIDNICVQPIDKHEEIQIVLKRKLEKIVYRSYRKHNGK